MENTSPKITYEVTVSIVDENRRQLKMDVNDLQARVEVAMETLLRSADARVNWKEQQLEGSANGSPYTFLPGVYRTSCTDTDDTIESGDKSVVDSECGCYSILLHGDNTFEYTWTMHRQAPRAMEYTVEITGDWVKPVLNRSRRGEEDHRIFLTSKRIRFQRLSNYGNRRLFKYLMILWLIVPTE